MKNKNIDEYINIELKKFKFNTTSLGYKYLKRAIKIGIEDEILIEDLNNRLYEKMQNEFMINKRRIKWNIEKSLDNMYLNTNMKYLMRYFYIEENEKVTPKLFITTIVENYFR